MDSIKEGNGTLLDNTMVVIGNEFVSGTAHDTDPWPVFIAGSGAGRFKTGRFVNFPTPAGGRLGPGPAHDAEQRALRHAVPDLDLPLHGGHGPAGGRPHHGPAGPAARLQL